MAVVLTVCRTEKRAATWSGGKMPSTRFALRSTKGRLIESFRLEESLIGNVIDYHVQELDLVCGWVPSVQELIEAALAARSAPENKRRNGLMLSLI